jgi:lipopolysaccharide export system permease protein
MYASPFIATFFLVLFFLIMQFFWLYVDDLIGKGLSFFVIIKLLYYISFSLVPMALPLAILLSSIMTFGNLSENYELAAMKSSGISLFRIMRPLIILMILMSIGTFYFSNYAVPYANFKGKNLLYNITKQKPALNLKPGIFNTSIPGYSIRFREKHGDNDEFLKDLIIYDHNINSRKAKSIVAKEGKMETEGGGQYLKLTLYDGYMYEESSDTESPIKSRNRQPFNKTKFKTNVVYFDLSSFNMDNIGDEKFKTNYSMMNNDQLTTQIDTLNIQYEKSRQDYVNKIKSRIKYSDRHLGGEMPPLDTTAYNKSLNENIEKLSSNDSVIRNIVLDHFTREGERSRVISQGVEQARRIYKYLGTVKTSIRYRKEDLARHIMEIHRKFAFSYICIVMFFVGAPLGAIIRKGGLGMPVVIAVVIFIFYHVTFLTAEKLGRSGALDPFWARWLPALIMTPFGILLTRKATTDSAIMNSELYFAPIYKLLDKFKKKNQERKNKK